MRRYDKHTVLIIVHVAVAAILTIVFGILWLTTSSAFRLPTLISGGLLLTYIVIAYVDT